ncbi:MAG: methionine biosynthesis protein MetW, partial [Gallionella sp.]
MSAHDSIELAAARPDFAAIAAWIVDGASVLDLGCGDGSLLRYLKEKRK